MKKFNFQFQTLEKVRRTREDEALRALSEAQRAYAAAQEQKNAQLRALESSLVRREEMGGRGAGFAMAAFAFQLENDFIGGTKQRIVQADQAILRARRGVERALRNYIQARRQTRMIELLREKAYGEFKTAKAKHEQKQLDDLTIMRTRLKRQESA